MRGRKRAAFTLTEMVVSIGVMVLMLITAGQVFTLTLGSTGKAQALTAASQSLRLFEEMLRDELASVDPTASMMVIEPHTINAYWTQSGKETDIDQDPSNGYPHPADPEREMGTTNVLDLPRADILMFFTGADSTGYTGGLPTPASAQVLVYGHAELGEMDAAGTWSVTPVTFPPDATTYFNQPASSWHLARRSIVLVPTPVAANNGFEDCLNDDPNSPNVCMDDGSGYSLRDGRLDVVEGAPSYRFSENLALYQPPGAGGPWVLAPAWYARSRLDTTPPALWANRMGHYLLPGCASFKVEWTIDVPARDPALAGEPEVYWFDPGNPNDPLGRLQIVIDDPNTTPARFAALDILRNVAPTGLETRFGLGSQDVYDDLYPAIKAPPTPPLWMDVDPITPTTRDPDPFFPTALRITVDVMDREGRFERPLRHVMVIPVGKK